MKKHLNLALVFGIYGLCCGVYFREFTKFNNFTERTTLGMVHPHILGLGLCGFIIVALFVRVLHIKKSKRLEAANIFYICGLILTSVMMLYRGTTEVIGENITNTASAVISGIAGIGHIAVAVGIILYIVAFKKADS